MYIYGFLLTLVHLQCTSDSADVKQVLLNQIYHENSSLVFTVLVSYLYMYFSP